MVAEEREMLGLERANLIADGTLAEARRRQLAALGVVVLDSGGNLVVAKREDGAGFMRVDIAHAKAWGSLGMGFGSRELAERAKSGPTFIAALAAISGGRIAPSPGGILIRDKSGSILGAIGVSGDEGDKDEAVAIVAIESLGLTAVPGALR
jgi:uncharacterized protein GlcG (DUF336 family)